ncbi:MAG: TlpA family protein disulfide reductase [Firmicutes bacterium]|nr:TlpA family protein disulfide reductase [Bacillota bacterium]
MSKKKVLILILVLALLMVGGTLLYKQLLSNTMPGVAVTEEEGETEAETKHLMPDFTVYDGAGGAVRLSDFRGKPVVLNFWASWCGPCKSEMPAFNEAAEELGGEVIFLMVNLTDGYQETTDTASAFIEEQGYTFPVFYDTDLEAAQAYGVSSVPVTYFIDEEGYGVGRAMGAIDKAYLQAGIDMIYQP